MVREVVHAESHLLQVVRALDACRGLAGFLHRRQEQADQDGNDGDHYQQLDQGESPSLCGNVLSDSHGCHPPSRKLRGSKPNSTTLWMVTVEKEKVDLMFSGWIRREEGRFGRR